MRYIQIDLFLMEQKRKRITLPHSKNKITRHIAYLFFEKNETLPDDKQNLDNTFDKNWNLE
ncbi:hypothetical protein LH29_10895 [Draconibacterium sediminis]|uniref:Uncharacterized protein n=1 Tax=Draconibacterium sediminis TaxID=1544798 RepID=A0A0D8J9M7_9BACT|nr:hypothetical protein LH29_10895 [Draconibacterium sediminis]